MISPLTNLALWRCLNRREEGGKIDDENDPSDAMKKQLRVLYAVGPGDVVGTHRDLSDDEISICFSRLFLDWCDESGAHAHLISWHTRRDSFRSARYFIENYPKPSLYYQRGVNHHFGSIAYGLNVVAKSFRERPCVVVIDSGTSHWIVFSLLSFLRIPVIAVMHSTLWPMGFPPKRKVDRLLRWLDGLFFRRFAAATVCVSPECERQVRQVARVLKGPIYQCRAQFRPDLMSRITPVPPHEIRPFRVLFVGRLEVSKGVFLILSAAECLEREMPGEFRWKIVGGGSSFEALTRQVVERNLGHVIEVTGRLPRHQALEAYGWAHSMIVPTTERYSEGLAMTAAEAVLAGRPVVVSKVVPAWEVLGDAAIRAETGDVDSFVEAFRRLALDSGYYDRCRRATSSAQQQFYQVSEGLGAVVGRAIRAATRSKDDTE